MKSIISVALLLLSVSTAWAHEDLSAQWQCEPKNAQASRAIRITSDANGDMTIEERNVTSTTGEWFPLANEEEMKVTVARDDGQKLRMRVRIDSDDYVVSEAFTLDHHTGLLRVKGAAGYEGEKTKIRYQEIFNCVRSY